MQIHKGRIMIYKLDTQMPNLKLHILERYSQMLFIESVLYICGICLHADQFYICKTFVLHKQILFSFVAGVHLQIAQLHMDCRSVHRNNIEKNLPP